MKVKIKKLTSMIMLCISIFFYAVSCGFLYTTTSVIAAILLLLPVIVVIFDYISLVSQENVRINDGHIYNIRYIWSKELHINKECYEELYFYKDVTKICVYLLSMAICLSTFGLGIYFASLVITAPALGFIHSAGQDRASKDVFFFTLGILFVIIMTIDACITEFKYFDTNEDYISYNISIDRAKWLSDEEKDDLRNFYFDDIMHYKDSICSETTEKRQSMKNAIRTSYNNIEIPAPKELYVIRCWFNSDETPSTYSAYGKFESSLTVKSGFFTSHAQQKNNIDYLSKFVGEDETKYVNLVLSDGSYYRLNLKNDENWLLVKEGDKVIKTYYKNEFDENNLNQAAVYSKINLIF